MRPPVAACNRRLLTSHPTNRHPGLLLPNQSRLREARLRTNGTPTPQDLAGQILATCPNNGAIRPAPMRAGVTSRQSGRTCAKRRCGSSRLSSNMHNSNNKLISRRSNNNNSSTSTSTSISRIHHCCSSNCDHLKTGGMCMTRIGTGDRGVGCCRGGGLLNRCFGPIQSHKDTEMTTGDKSISKKPMGRNG